jgi:Ca2+-dependent lipid-binding protein
MMDIPFLSKFISESINSAAKEYMAPKSLMLDLQQLLSGDGISRGECGQLRRRTAHLVTLTDTVHIGVIVVHIHRVTVEKSAKEGINDSEISYFSCTGCQSNFVYKLTPM